VAESRFDDEVVTQAAVTWHGEASAPFALVTLDNGHDQRRPNTFGPAGLAALDTALDEAFGRVGVVGVAVTGKASGFAVGADLSGITRITSRERAAEVGRLGHRVFRRLHDSPVPTFALVQGAALGGGLELALACHYRAAAAAAGPLGLPECLLGLVPGWGGTQLLPGLVGPEKALGVMVDGALNQRPLSGAQAHAIGMVDALIDGEDFVSSALEWARGVVAGSVRVARADVPRDETWDAAVERARGALDARLRGSAPAPYRALDLVQLAKDGDLDAGFVAEEEALSDLVMSDELRSGLYAFDLVQRRAKRPAGVPADGAREVRKVGVVGAGLMASQLGLLFAQRLRVPVVLTDVDQERVDKGVAYVHGEVDKLLQRGKLSAEQAAALKASVTGSLTKDAFSDADFVIEAVFEELKVKQQVLAELEAVVSDTCILATNTSSLSITDMSADLAHPERVVGFHFFNPVAVLPLLEVVRTASTDDTTLATAFFVASKLRKSAVLVKDAPAFVVNRLLTRFLGEITRSVDEGTPIEVADHALDPLGLPMSPMLLLGLVGPAVALHVAKTLHAAYPERFYVSDNLATLVAAGKPGIYTWGAEGQQVDPEVAAMFSPPADAAPMSGEQVRDRALDALAQEIRLLLDDGVVAEAADVDLCLLLGAGWPYHLGGITPYLDRSGVSERATGRRFHTSGVAGVPR
jgi:3-hydroxyacyl-CoA dehydrogenase/enoyl-CoA hydratase/carnithine racemase